MNKVSITSSGTVSVDPFALDDWNCDTYFRKFCTLTRTLLFTAGPIWRFLRIYDPEELRKSNDKLLCGGFVRTSRFESILNTQ